MINKKFRKNFRRKNCNILLKLHTAGRKKDRNIGFQFPEHFKMQNMEETTSKK
jgi:hypothetical protein